MQYQKSDLTFHLKLLFKKGYSVIFLKGFQTLDGCQVVKNTGPKKGETNDCSSLLPWESLQAAAQRRRPIQSPTVSELRRCSWKSVKVKAASLQGRIPKRRELHRDRVLKSCRKVHSSLPKVRERNDVKWSEATIHRAHTGLGTVLPPAKTENLLIYKASGRLLKRVYCLMSGGKNSSKDCSGPN